jgi:hypothetical protein
MRTVQLILFGLAVVSFVAALGFIGDDTGDVLWRLGLALLLTDLVCIRLWPGNRPA